VANLRPALEQGYEQPMPSFFLHFLFKCREESNLGLCMSSVLAKKMPLRSAVRSNKTQPQAACRLMWGWVFLERTRAVRSNKTQPCLKVKMGLGIFRPKADSQWNLVYNAFHRIFCSGKETIRN